MKKVLKIYNILGIVFLLNNLANANENRIIFHGFTKHSVSEDKYTKEKFNEQNWGIGYEYNTYDKNDNLYLTSSINVLKDSYKNPFYFVTTGVHYRFNKLPISLNVDGLLGYKKMKLLSIVNGKFDHVVEEKYDFLGGIMPGFSIYIKDFSINYNYSPSISFNGMYSEGFHYLSFSYKL